MNLDNPNDLTWDNFSEDEITYIDMGRVLVALTELTEEQGGASVEEIVEFFDEREWTQEQEEQAKEAALHIALKESENNLENRQDT